MLIANRFNHICYLHSYYSVEIESCEVSDVLAEAKRWVEIISFKLKEFQQDQSEDDFIVFTNCIQDKERQLNIERKEQLQMDIDKEIAEIPKANKLDFMNKEKSKKLNLLKINK